ncbi:enoyl-CoA hydratase family protein [Gordonia sp. TBRC 11910]|uniref:Enoyl-CoA hydratase family protein n=1 Tax=Gordonia asplenii TaxID=2725283 RepID=A0A848KZ85_9ACTN|nr:enoyl-CoA hydratase family protein [Gordonia asplenii]NMO02155.1 enoyl-CoA hydratase family protein [Gordonia asplenii]
MSDELVHTEIDAGIATLTLDSPSNRNALSGALVSQLIAALTAARDDADVRAVKLTHTGGTFCAGADLSEALTRGLSPEEATAEGASAMNAMMRTILESPKPVIVVVNGHVRAGGFGLLGAADMVVAGPASTFALTEARLGLAPSMISIVLLPKMTARSVGRYFLTGEKFGATEAERMGLITVAAGTADEVGPITAEILDGIRKASPQGLAVSKSLTTAAILADFDRQAAERAAESAGLFGTDEAREGMTAFFEKRRPRWDVSA